MDKFQGKGPSVLQGEVTISGAKCSIAYPVRCNSGGRTG